jgi:hypothetical protein
VTEAGVAGESVSCASSCESKVKVSGSTQLDPEVIEHVMCDCVCTKCN